MGAKSFSARQNAKNFSDDELLEAVKYCNLHMVKVYLAVNTIIFDEQTAEVEKTLKLAGEIGVDALIIQDLGVTKNGEVFLKCRNVRLNSNDNPYKRGRTFCKRNELYPDCRRKRNVEKSAGRALLRQR